MSTTCVVGKLGYLVPKLPRTGKATTVAFGAFLLEVVTGRRPIEPKLQPEELVLVVDWVWDLYREGKLLDVVDRRFGGKFDAAEVTMVAKLGLICSSNAALAQPSMRQVVRYLEGEVSLPEMMGDLSGDFEGRKTSQEGFSTSPSFGSNNLGGILNSSFNSLSMSPLSLLRGRGESTILSD